MSAPLLWIAFPLACAVVFWFIRARAGLVALLATLLALLLALLAWIIPVGQAIHLFGRTYELAPSLEFAGRAVTLDNYDRPLLIVIYMICAFWFTGSNAGDAPRIFIPLGLAINALLLAAISVEPLLYSALLVEMVVLISIPLLAPPRMPFSQGVLRFLIFQTLAVPFILLAGWALGEADANPNNATLFTLSLVFLGLGFAFWLAVFPFSAWLPLLAEQSFPYVAGFLFLVILSANLLIGLGFIDQYAWLRANPVFLQLTRTAGLLMIATSGVWAAFQNDLSRLFGYGVLVETGFSILAMSLGTRLGYDLFAAMFVTRALAFGLWALSLSILLRHARSTRFEDVQGLSSRVPVASAALAVAALTLAGLPLLAEFPIRQTLMEELARQSLPAGLAALAGTVGMLFSTFRALAVLVRGSLMPQGLCETRSQVVLLSLGALGLLAMGILPQLFLPMTFPLLWSFPHLP